MVADWDCIVRNLVWARDGRVKPGHDGGRRLVLHDAFAMERFYLGLAQAQPGRDDLVGVLAQHR